MITQKDIIRQQLILKHSREILRLERNIEKKTVIIRKLEKEKWRQLKNVPIRPIENLAFQDKDPIANCPY